MELYGKDVFADVFFAAPVVVSPAEAFADSVFPELSPLDAAFPPAQAVRDEAASNAAMHAASKRLFFI